LGILLLCGSSAYANLLTNGSFESPGGSDQLAADGWVTVQDADFMILPTPEPSMLYQPWGGHDGTELLWFKSWMGGASWLQHPELPGDRTHVEGDVKQAVAGTPDTFYVLSGWFRSEQYASIGDPLAETHQYLAIDFLDAGMGVLSSLVVDVPGLNDNAWHEAHVSGISAPGTVYVQARVSFDHGIIETLNPQGMFADDLILVPEPATGLILLSLLVLRRR